MGASREAATAETRCMLERWGALHAGRSALGLVATLIFLWASGEAADRCSARCDGSEHARHGTTAERDHVAIRARVRPDGFRALVVRNTVSGASSGKSQEFQIKNL